MFKEGALSVTLEDAANQPLLEPGLGETPLWAVVTVTALFDGIRDHGMDRYCRYLKDNE